ncbi:MAG: hypothetical protein JSC189_000758 [Candidatus Tokpelaia sp. JSC189]|nr:MAG: hypothetical protein JSC189_000758 [Candidatus Tokpelaia sp. JSC189]
MGYGWPILSPEDVIEKISGTDGVMRIDRYDLISHMGEDITEEVAEAYIRYFGDKIDEDSDVDEWLLNSRAYEDHIEALEAEALEDSIYGSYEDQNRLRLSDVL